MDKKEMDKMIERKFQEWLLSAELENTTLVDAYRKGCLDGVDLCQEVFKSERQAE